MALGDCCHNRICKNFAKMQQMHQCG
jgi:hypothetical protein